MKRSRLVVPIVTLAIVFGVFAVAHSSRGTMAVLTDNVSSDEQYFEAGFWVCTYTLGYWKNHPAAWPVEDISIGGETYTQEEAIDILKTKPRGDATYILAHQLIAAKLNVLIGANPSAVETTIAEADEWLIDHPLGSDPSKPDRAQGIALADTLDDYNNGVIGPGHCDDETTTLEPPIECTLDLEPDPLNLTGEGDPVTAYIELSADLAVNDIDVSSILLEDSIPALSAPTDIEDYVPSVLLQWVGDSTLESLEEGIPAYLALTEVGDHDGDGIPDLMVQFDRSAVVAMFSSQAGEVTLTLTGETTGGLAFEGNDTIRLEPVEMPTATATVTPTATNTPTPTATPTEEPTVAPTLTETPTPTETPTEEPTPTETPTPTEEPTTEPPEAPIEEPTPTETPVPTETPTEEPTPTETSTPTETPTEEPTPTETSTPTEAPTEEPTPTETSTPTEAPTEEPTPTETSTPTEAPTEELTEEPTEEPT